MYIKKLSAIIIPLLAIFCFSANSFANEIKLRNKHPQRHVVVKGDTLWDISNYFLKTPWLWPKLWRMNRNEIKNPHLIYPGDVVVLDTSGASPSLRLLRETVTLKPGIRVEKLEKKAIKAIPQNVITPFLTQPLLIENDQLNSAPRIVAGPDNRVMFSPGSRVYINNIEQGSNRHWDIYRAGAALIDPDTNEVIGTEAIYLGDLNIIRYGKPASADILHVKEEIFVKDRLIESQSEFRSNYVPHAPESKLHGRIMKIHGSLAEAGANTVVSLNLGKNDSLEEGHVLAISRNGRVIKDPEYGTNPETKPSNDTHENANAEITLAPDQLKLPDERIGLLMVFRVFEHVSYALIMNASMSVHKYDVVHTP